MLAFGTMVTVSLPALLLALIVVLVSTAIAVRRFRRRALLLAVFPLAAAGLLGVSLEVSERSPRRVVLVDASASVAGDGEDALSDPLRWIADLDADGAASFYAFGSRVVRLAERASPDAFETVGPLRPTASVGRGTDLESALLTVSDLEPDVTEVLVLTDGRETRGRAATAVEALRARGIRVTFHALGRDAARDVRLRAIRAPETVREGETFRVEVDVEGPPGTGATLRLALRSELDGAPIDLPTSAARMLLIGPSGRTRTGYDLRLMQSCRLDAEVAPDEGEDPVPANDRRSVLVRLRARPVVHARADADAAVVAILRREGLEVRRHDALDARGLVMLERAGRGVVLLQDVPVRTLPRELAAAVFRGMGLLVVGGEKAFGFGGYAGTWLEEALPLRARRDDDDGLTIVVLADVSGSMNDPFAGATAGRKARAARLAVGALLDALPPGTRVAVLPFAERVRGDGELRVLGDEEGGVALRRIVEALDREVRGGTDLGLPLARSLEILAELRGRRHVVVVSDGEVGADGAVLETIRSARDGLRRAGATLSVIVTGGDEAGRAVLRNLADEGSFHEVSSAAALGETLLDDLRRKAGEGLRVTGSARVRGAATMPEDAPLPPSLVLSSWLRTWPRNGARVVLETATDPSWPVLAVGRHGLGRTAAVPTTPRPGAEWGQGFWAGLVERLAPPEDDPGLVLALEREDDTTVRVVLTARDGAGGFRALDRPRLNDGPALLPTGAGRYEALIEDEPGVDGARPPLTVLEGDGRRILTSSPPWPRPREFLATGPDRQALADLSALAEAGLDPPATGTRDVSFLPLLLAALLLVTEAALKSRRKATDGPVGGEHVRRNA